MQEAPALLLPNPLREHALSHVRSMILSAALPPGARVNEVALSRELGVSRTPLREALFGLEREGLIVARPRRGFFVSPLDVKDAREIYPLLATLESFALRAGAPQIRRDRAELARLNAAFRTTGTREPVTLVETDRAWHERLISHAGNDRLVVMLRQLRAAAVRFELRFLADGKSVAESGRQHAAILDAVARGRVTAACRLLEDNWLRGLRRVEEGMIS